MQNSNRVRVFEKKMPSDASWGLSYQVYLFSNGQGTCECKDFHNRGVVAGNLNYRCKHVDRAFIEYESSKKPRTVSTASKPSLNNSGNRVVTVHADQHDNLYLSVSGTYPWIGGQSPMVSEAEVYEAFAAARLKLQEERTKK